MNSPTKTTSSISSNLVESPGIISFFVSDVEDCKKLNLNRLKQRRKRAYEELDAHEDKLMKAQKEVRLLQTLIAETQNEIEILDKKISSQ